MIKFQNKTLFRVFIVKIISFILHTSIKSFEKIRICVSADRSRKPQVENIFNEHSFQKLRTEHSKFLNISSLNVFCRVH